MVSVGVFVSLIAIVDMFRTVRSNPSRGTKVQKCRIALGCVAFAWFIIYRRVLTPKLKSLHI